jgi:multidrug resistance efflux pump
MALKPSEAPVTAPRAEFATPVRVQTIERAPFSVSASGFGRVQAERSWSAIAQVEGRVSALAPGLAVGRVMPSDVTLVRTDPRDYEIALAKAKAGLAAAQAEMAEIDVEERNTNASLILEREVEELLLVEFERQQTLVERGTVAKTTADAANRTLLAQRKVVTNLENELVRYPAQRVTVEADIRARQADLEHAKRDLEHTLITAPFEGRVASEALEIGQYVRVGDTLLTIEAVDASEITAEFQPHVLGAMLRAMMQGEVPVEIDISGNDGPLSLFAHFGITAEVVVRRQERL